MSRNKKEANTAIFKQLDDWAREGGHDPPNFGQPRWLSSSEDSLRFLTHGRVAPPRQFGATRALTQILVDDVAYIGCIGFNSVLEHDLAVEKSVGGAHATLILSEIEVTPTATPVEVYQAIGGIDGRDSNYDGHGVHDITNLFPPVTLYELKVDPTDADAVVWLLCLSECASGESWIEETLAKDLAELTDRRELGLPFDVLTRSVFDQDPGSLFLALYRCIEALYSYNACVSLGRSLKQELNLSGEPEWRTLAGLLEREISWYPQERNSLTTLLKNCDRAKLDAVIAAFPNAGPDSKEIATQCTRLIYELRNSLVHFRPGLANTELAPNWSVLCSAMVYLVMALYDHVTQ